MLCVAITPATAEDVFTSDLRLAECVEVRLDHLRDPLSANPISWNRLNLPVIATCSPIDRGGRFKGTADDERRILEKAVHNGASFIEVDYRDAFPCPGAKVIGAYHNFEETPADIRRYLENACANPAIQIGKVVTTVRSWSDNRRLLELLAQPWNKPVIVVGMGEMGQITQLVGPSRGAYLTYALPAPAAGEMDTTRQLTADELINGYRYGRIRRSTRLFGVVGNPVTHSRGYLMHNRAFEKAGVDFAYLKFPVTDVHDFFENASAIGIGGFSVTMPHKTAVIPHLAKMTPAAHAVGAVNTVSQVDGGWMGDNTDVDGARAAMDSVHFDPSGKRIVILGKGGAAKAAAYAVRNASSLTMLARYEVKHGGEYDCDLLINATPMGMAPHVNESPVEGKIGARVVFDMVYTPQRTRLLQLAAEQGKTVVAGTTMFYAQAARQFEIWTGQLAPSEIYQPGRTT